jgi:muramoyltetrapeptide carboxypeptidase
MILPDFLQEGDSVAIVSAARKISLGEITPAINLLKSWGLKVVIGDTIDLTENQYAGSDEERTKDFQAMLDNTKVKAIWCARGGYGTLRIIDQLDFSSFLKNPKWIIGYSDITVLHSHLHNSGVASSHATMPINVQKNTKKALKSLKKTLFGQKIDKSVSFSKKNKLGKGKGKLVGGNLSILYSLLGSKTSINTDGKILFIEDLDEYLYHVDRMIIGLKRNGYFDNLQGLIVGGMTQMHDNTIPFGKTAKEIILDAVSEYDFPVCFKFPAGHIDDNRALMLGAEVEMEATDKGYQLTYL